MLSRVTGRTGVLPSAALAAVLVVGLVVGLAGCEGEAKPSPLPDPSSSAASPSSASPSASASAAPSLPAAAKGRTAKSAEAFARHYIDLINYLGATGDSEPLAAVSAPSCSVCEAVIDEAQRVYGEGGRFEGGTWTSRRPSTALGSNGRNALVTFVVVVSPQVEVSRSGRRKAIAGSKGLLDLQLVAARNSWAVREMDAK